MDTAAIMKNLDLVITSDTAIAHLAGALGVPVWVALPLVPDWRWLLRAQRQPMVSHHAALPAADPGRLGRRVRGNANRVAAATSVWQSGREILFSLLKTIGARL